MLRWWSESSNDVGTRGLDDALQRNNTLLRSQLDRPVPVLYQSWYDVGAVQDIGLAKEERKFLDFGTEAKGYVLYREVAVEAQDKSG